MISTLAPFRISVLSIVLSITMSSTGFSQVNLLPGEPLSRENSPKPTPKNVPLPPTPPLPLPTPTPEVEQDENREEKKVKHKVEPFFFIDFDWGSWISNLTPYRQSVAPVPTASKSSDIPQRDRMIVDDYSEGIQKMSHNSLTGGLGAKMTWWYEHTSGLEEQWWAYVGIMPILGRNVDSVRYFPTRAAAENSRGYTKVPGRATHLDSWAQGDSITYVSRGGVLFAAGTGLSVIGVGTSALANGSWETYIEKIESDKVYLKITKGKVLSLSVFSGAVVAGLSRTAFKSADDGFSFLYNMNTRTGRKAYEDAIRGNISASERIAEVSPANYVESTPVMRVSTFTTLTTGRFIGAQLGLPIIWNNSYNRGRVASFTATDFHISNKVAKAHYGIYSEENNYRFWNKHRETDLMFYGAHYTISDANSTDVGMFGRYSYAYKNDHSNREKLNRAIRSLVRRTGMDELRVEVPSHNLGYTAIDFDTTLSEEHTLNLIRLAQRRGKGSMQTVAERYLNGYSTTRDSLNVCRGEFLAPLRKNCRDDLRSDSYRAIDKMYGALIEMGHEKDRDPKAFARAYGEFGEAMSKNFVTFRTIMELAGPGVEINYLLEGTRMSMYYKSWKTTETPNRWAVVDNPNGRTRGSPFPFEPRLRRSKVRGIIVNPNHGGLEFFQRPLRLGTDGLQLTLDTTLAAEE